MRHDSRPAPGDGGPARRRGAFYGWTVVGVVSALSFAGGVETNPVLGIFQDPMTDEFAWSRAAFTLPMSIGTFAGGLAAVFTGPLMDRYGGRGVMTFAVVLLGLIFVGMGLLEAYWQYFALQLMGRTLVASTFFMIIGVILPKWFIAKRGRAIGISALGQRLGHAAFPVFIERVMAFSSWRTAAIALGVTVWATALLPAALLLRRRPEDMGQLPDGATRDLRAVGAQREVVGPGTDEVSFKRGEAMRTPAFHLLLAALSAQSFVATGINFHWFSYLTGNGVSSGVTIASLAIAPLVGMPASVIAGFIAEKVPPQMVLAVAYVMTAGAIGILLVADNPVLAIVFGVVYGSAMGIQLTNNQVIWADFFGRDSIGGIRGIIAPVQMFTNALGPLAAALSFDLTGGYDAIFSGGIVVLLASAALAALARKPVHASRQAS
jgi:MFS family permease